MSLQMSSDFVPGRDFVELFLHPYNNPTPTVTRIASWKSLDALVQNRPPAVLYPNKLYSRFLRLSTFTYSHSFSSHSLSFQNSSIVLYTSSSLLVQTFSTSFGSKTSCEVLRRQLSSKCCCSKSSAADAWSDAFRSHTSFWYTENSAAATRLSH